MILSDPEMMSEWILLNRSVECVDTLNDPRKHAGDWVATSGEGVQGGPSCPRLAAETTRIIRAARAAISKAINDTTLREQYTPAEMEKRKHEQEVRAVKDAERAALAKEIAEKNSAIHRGKIDAAVRYRNRQTKDTSGLKKGSA